MVHAAGTLLKSQIESRKMLIDIDLFQPNRFLGKLVKDFYIAYYSWTFQDIQQWTDLNADKIIMNANQQNLNV